MKTTSFIKFTILGFSCILILGCTISFKGSIVNDETSNNSSIVTADTTAPDITSVILNDGNFSTSTTQSPTLTWNAASDSGSGVSSYEIAIGTTAGGSDIKTWTNVGNVTSTNITSLTLALGTTYYASLRAIDGAGNVSSIVQGNGWYVNNALSLSPVGTIPSPISLITGESQIFTPSGGLATFTFSDNGTGYINTSSGLYSVPFNISPTTDTVTVTDSVGSTAMSFLKLRAFETKDSNLLDTTTVSNAFSLAVAVDSSNNIYAVGNAVDGANVSHWITRKSSDGGTTWSTVDDFNYSFGKNSYALSITIIGTSVYVAGYANDAAYINTWIVRKSTDGGTTWSTVDSYNAVAVRHAAALAIKSYGSTLYVSGYASNSSYIQNWVVRKSTDGGTTWTTIDTYLLYSMYGSYAKSINIDISGNLYVGGYATDSSNITHWFVRKSTDGGSTWSISDDYNYIAAKSSSVYSLTSDNLGTIYAVGYGTDSSNIFHAIIRKSTDRGASWSTINDYNYAASKESSYSVIIFSGSGNIFVAGYGTDSSSVTHWIIRKSTDNGSTWSTVNDYNFSATKNSNSYGIANDSTNNLFSVGTALDTSNRNHWIVHKSSDDGATWSTVNDYSLVKGGPAYGSVIAKDISGNLYSAGSAVVSSVYHWIVRKSTDGGNTWSFIDNYNLTSQSSVASSLTIDAASNIYTAGYGNESSSITHWIVRKSTNAGSTWSTVDNYQLSGTTQSIANALVTDTAGNIYVAGLGLDATYAMHWIIRKSINGGSTWNTISNFNLVAGKASNALALVADGSSNIYAAGYGVDSSNVQHWLVRKSTDGGTTWSTVDDYNLSAANQATPYALTIDGSGNIYTVGYAADASGISHWIVRKSTNAGVSWNTVSDYNRNVSKNSNAYSITSDSANNLYTSGTAIDASNVSHWIVRKSSDGGTAWTTIDDKASVNSSTIVANSIIPCLSNQICVAGTGNFDLTKPPAFTTRILSP